MQLNITGKNIELTAGIRDYINKKITKLIADFEHPVNCDIVLEVEKNRHIIEIILSGDSGRFYFKKAADDLYKAIDNTISVQMCYNLYNSFKNSRLDRSLTKNLKIVQVAYSYYDDMFVLLMNGNNKTIIGLIEHLESIHSIGTQINFMNISSCHCPQYKNEENHHCDKCNYKCYDISCSVLIIDYIPVCICPVDKKKIQFN